MYMMTSYDITVMSLMTSHTSSSKCANDQNLVVIYTFHPKWRFHVITTLCRQKQEACKGDRHTSEVGWVNPHSES